MSIHNPYSLPFAVRVYPEPPVAEGDDSELTRARKWRCPRGMIIFDTETRVDTTQKLTFGSYRIFRDGICYEEGLFYGDDLPEHDRRLLMDYVTTHTPETHRERPSTLKLLTRTQFVDLLYIFAYKRRYLLVAFNLPFDISRVAVDFTEARGRFAGGFALELWSYIDQSGREQPDPYRPRVAIKHIDSKRALKAFTARQSRCRGPHPRWLGDGRT